MAGHGPSDRNLDPGIRLILEELRDLRVEMRADRRRWEDDRRRADAERRQSDQRFEQVMREFRQGFRDMRAAGLSIVKTLNHHTRILERIDRKLGARPNGRPGPDGGNGYPGR